MTAPMLYVAAGRATARLTTETAAPEIIGEYYAPSDLYSAELRNDATDGTVTVYSGRAMGAARLVLRGKAWSEDDRVECAGHIAAHVIGARSNLTGTPREVCAYIDWAMAHPLTAAMRETAIPHRDATMTRLMGLASNWARAENRRRATENRAHSERVTLTGLTTEQGEQAATYEHADDRALRIAHERVTAELKSRIRAARAVKRCGLTRAERVTIFTATVDALIAADARVQRAECDPHHIAARALLASLGLPCMGRAYVAAYTASAMGGVSGNDLSVEERKTAVREIAATMGLSSPDVLRVYLSRSRKAIPSASHPHLSAVRATVTVTAADGTETNRVSGESPAYMAHADLMGVTAETYTGKPHASKTEHAPRMVIRSAEVEGVTVECECTAGKTETGEHRPAAPLACPVHPLTRNVRDAELVAPSTRPAYWTETLRDSTRDRLSTAADIRDSRTANR